VSANVPTNSSLDTKKHKLELKSKESFHHSISQHLSSYPPLLVLDLYLVDLGKAKVGVTERRSKLVEK
jgi:hypothetical protein